MKSKKLFLPTIVFSVAVLAMLISSFVLCIAKKPTVTEGEFPFTITYELDGEKVTVDEVYKVRYDRNGGYTDTKTRIYVGEIGDMGSMSLEEFIAFARDEIDTKAIKKQTLSLLDCQEN